MSKGIKERIKKLLALAQDAGATEAESTSAMEMATSLMMKYNLRVDLDEDDKITIRGPRCFEDMKDKWQLGCASTAAYLYSCRVIKEYGGGFSFVGRPDNIDAVQDLTSFIIDQVNHQYKVHLPNGLTTAQRGEFRRTFKMACSIKVFNRAVEIMTQIKTNDDKALAYTGSTALIVRKQNEVQLQEADSLIKSMSGLRNTKHRPTRSGNGTQLGYKAGDNVQLNKQLA